MIDPKDRKSKQITSNETDITNPDENDENEENIQDRLEDMLIEAEENMRESYLDEEETDFTSNAPNITDTPPRKDDERH